MGARDRDLERLLKHRVLLFLTWLLPFATSPHHHPHIRSHVLVRSFLTFLSLLS